MTELLGDAELEDAVRGVGGGVVWTYLNLAVVSAATVFMVGFGIRTLGASSYGTFAIIQSLALLLFVVDVGLGLVLVRAAALRVSAADGATRDRAAVEVAIAHQVYVTVGLVVAVIGAVGAGVLAVVVHNTSTPITCLLVMLAAAADLALAGLQGVATGLRAFGALARASIVGTVVSTVVLVGFLSAWGLPALGAAQLSGVLVTRLLLTRWARTHASWFTLRYHWAQWTDIKRVLGLAFPLVVINAGAQLINAVNLMLIGAVVSTGGAGLYRAASTLPSQAAAALFRGVDVAFPGLVSVTSATNQERMNRILTRVASYVAGLLFGVAIVARSPITHALIGTSSSKTAQILVIFCLVWLVNVPVHGFVLLVIARGEQRLFVRLTMIEAGLNLPLTVGLSFADGARGAALATLVTIIVSNVVVLPWMLRALGLRQVWSVVAVDGLLRCVVGLATAGAAGLVITQDATSITRAIAMAGAAVGLGVVIGAVSIGADGRSLIRSAVRPRLPHGPS